MLESARKSALAVVVDEDATLRASAVALLEETKFDVVACGSGEAAVEVLRGRGDDVAMMLTSAALAGGMDGRRLANVVGKLWPGIRVVMSTGTPEACKAHVPEDAVCLRHPWLPLDVLVQAHAALRAPGRLVA